MLPSKDKLMITKDIIEEKQAIAPMFVSFMFKYEKKDITRKNAIPLKTEKNRCEIEFENIYYLFLLKEAVWNSVKTFTSHSNFLIVKRN